jgi:hypothetical protein
MEAMLKVVVVMTERYGRVLKGGNTDRNKLLFRSLAVFDRRMSSTSPEESAREAAVGKIRRQYPTRMW